MAVDPLPDLVRDAVDCLAEAVVAACADDALLHRDTQATSAEMVAELALEQALGPRLKKVLRELSVNVVTRASQRLAERYNHPRLSSDAAIRDLQDAQASLQRAILKHKSGSPASTLAITLATTRLIAITQAVGPDCVVAEKAGNKGAIHVRRKPTADDMPPKIKAIVEKMARGDEQDFIAGIDALDALRGTPHDVGSIATKLFALATDVDGFDHICTVVGNVIAARERKTLRAGNAGKAPARQSPNRREASPQPSELRDLASVSSADAADEELEVQPVAFDPAPEAPASPAPKPAQAQMETTRPMAQTSLFEPSGAASYSERARARRRGPATSS
ncbi:MAG: hypothetical protein C0491_07075 [Novosphingobium sp.]|nr:hypothetical protein [Novosphingobium sp.]